MFIYALAIYDDIARLDSRVVKVDYAQKKQPNRLFPENLLASLDGALIADDFPASMASNVVYRYPSEDEREFLYFKRIHANHRDVVLAIAIDKKLDLMELAFLFTNMAHIYIRPEKVKISLQHMVDNPLNYIGKDLLVDSLAQQVSETKEVLIENIHKILKRGEKLEEAVAASHKLKLTSEHFKDKAEELNRCRC